MPSLRPSARPRSLPPPQPFPIDGRSSASPTCKAPSEAHRVGPQQVWAPTWPIISLASASRPLFLPPKRLAEEISDPYAPRVYLQGKHQKDIMSVICHVVDMQMIFEVARPLRAKQSCQGSTTALDGVARHVAAGKLNGNPWLLHVFR